MVILSAAACLNCLYCNTGHPAYCIDHAKVTLAANEPSFVLASDKSKVIGGGYFGQSSFASPVPVKVSCASNVTQQIRNAEELRLFAPMGCGIMTGAGSITHVGRCQPEDVVGVVGLGGVGLAGVCAAKKLGVKNIIAIDVVESRVELAKQLGATAGLVSSPDRLKGRNVSLHDAIKEMSPQKLGCTHILDTTPSVFVLNECLEALRKNGTVFQVGVKPVGAKLELDLLPHMVNGRKLVGVIEGDRDPAEALPELVQWAKDGTLPMAKLTKEYPVKDFEAAKKVMEDGTVIKSVLVWS